MNTKLQQSEADAVALQKQIDDQAAALAAQEAERKRTAPLDPKARGTEFMQSHPEVRQALLDWFDERSRAQFQSLFEKLKLNPAQIQECLALMHENNWFGRSLATNDYAILSVESGLPQSEVTTRLKAILGPDGMKQYWATLAEQPIINLTSQAASGLAFSENPLSTSQASKLREIFLKYRQYNPAGLSFDWNKVAQDARQFLSAGQLEVIDALRDQNELQNAYNSTPTSPPATAASPALMKGKS